MATVGDKGLNNTMTISTCGHCLFTILQRGKRTSTIVYTE